MSLTKFALAGLMAVGLCLPAAAQTSSPIIYPADENSQASERPADHPSNANRRVVRRAEDNSLLQPANNHSRRIRQASYNSPMGERILPAASPELNPIPQDNDIESSEIVSDPIAMQYQPLGRGGPLSNSSSCGGGICDVGDCDGGCSECGGDYCNDCQRPIFGLLTNWGHKNLAIFGGVHGYKGPRDRGQNGNFGFQEGLNFGAPLGDPWGCGFQLGFQALESDITGSRVGGVPTADRHQYFATAGIFRRAEVGKIQWAVAFDYLYDTYSGSSSLKQIRSETGWLMTETTEIGYSGAYGIGGDTGTTQGTLVGRLAPTDQFVLYVRRYFENGGDGRLFGGVTGKGDGLIGADVWIPLSGSWALQNDFTFLIPKEGRGSSQNTDGIMTGGQVRETWGVAMNLVWYPGRSSRCVGESCYRPVLNVADNSQFMVNESFSQ